MVDSLVGLGTATEIQWTCPIVFRAEIVEPHLFNIADDLVDGTGLERAGKVEKWPRSPLRGPRSSRMQKCRRPRPTHIAGWCTRTAFAGISDPLTSIGDFHDAFFARPKQIRRPTAWANLCSPKVCRMSLRQYFSKECSRCDMCQPSTPVCNLITHPPACRPCQRSSGAVT